jgi:hypothetical protein
MSNYKSNFFIVTNQHRTDAYAGWVAVLYAKKCTENGSRSDFVIDLSGPRNRQPTRPRKKVGDLSRQNHTDDPRMKRENCDLSMLRGALMKSREGRS